MITSACLTRTRMCWLVAVNNKYAPKPSCFSIWYGHWPLSKSVVMTRLENSTQWLSSKSVLHFVVINDDQMAMNGKAMAGSKQANRATSRGGSISHSSDHGSQRPPRIRGSPQIAVGLGPGCDMQQCFNSPQNAGRVDRGLLPDRVPPPTPHWLNPPLTGARITNPLSNPRAKKGNQGASA
jgi:hypothetical protein